MVLMTCGAVGGTAAALGMTGEKYVNLAIGVLVVGFILYAVAEYISKISVETKPKPAQLRRIK